MTCASLCRWSVAIGLLLRLCAPLSARPITLEESLHHALLHNEVVQMARQDLERARQQIRHATADAFPQFDATFSYTRNWLLPSFIFDTPAGQQQVTVGAHNNLTSAIGIRQPLYSGGKTRAALRIAQLFRSFSEETVRATRQQIHAQVETSFYDLLLAQQLVRVSNTSVMRARANLDRVDKLYRAGRVSNYDLLRAQVQVAQLQTDSIRTQNDLDLAALTFKNVAGLDPTAAIEPHGTFRQSSDLPLTEGESSLITRSLEHQPAVRQHKLEVEMRQKAETVSKAGSRPTLDLRINGQWEAQKNDFGFSTNDFQQSWFSGLTLRIPLFDGFRTRAEVAQAKADTRRAELAWQQTERTARLNVMRAWRNVQETSARTSAQEKALELAQKGLRIAESRYDNGVGTQLEVIDGQLTLQRAEADLARARRDYAVALVHLEHSTGFLGESAPPKDTP